MKTKQVFFEFILITIVSDGHFLLAVSSGNVILPIQCYRVSVRKVDEKCIITSQALPGFFLQDATKDSQSKIFLLYKNIV